jgi:multiple sugar transport system substrate-binding protein
MYLLRTRRWFVAWLCLVVLMVSSAASAKVKITYTSWRSSGAGKAAEEEVVRRFNAIHPDIEVTYVPGPWSQALLEQLIVQVAGGAAPDVASLRGVTVGPILEQIAVDIAPFIQRDKYSLSRFMPVTLDLASRNGRVYGLPYGLGSLLIFYNKELLGKAGLPAPQRGWTVDEFRQYALRLTVDKQADGIPDQWGIDNIDAGKLYLWGQLFGGRFLSDDGSSVAITEPPFVKALQWAADLVNVDKVVRFIPTGATQWPSGNTAFDFSFESSIGIYIESQVDQSFAWGTAYMPQAPGMPSVTYGQWHILAALKTSKHPEAAWEFIKFYNSGEVQRFLGEQGLEPATIIGHRTFGLRGPVPAGSTREEVYGPILDPPEILTVPWQVPGMADIWNDLTAMFTRVLQGEENPQAAVDSVAPIVNAKLAQIQGGTR